MSAGSFRSIVVRVVDSVRRRLVSEGRIVGQGLRERRVEENMRFPNLGVCGVWIVGVLMENWVEDGIDL